MPQHRQWPVTRRLRLCNGRKGQKNGGPAPQLALGGNAAAMGFDEVLHNRESQSGTALLTRAARVNPVEALEDAWQVLGGDAAAGIGDPHEHLIARGRCEHADTPARWRVAQRVVEQVGENLAECFRIDADRAAGILDRGVEVDPLLCGALDERTPRLACGGLDFYGLRLRTPAAGFDS